MVCIWVCIFPSLVGQVIKCFDFWTQLIIVDPGKCKCSQRIWVYVVSPTFLSSILPFCQPSILPFSFAHPGSSWTLNRGLHKGGRKATSLLILSFKLFTCLLKTSYSQTTSTRYLSSFTYIFTNRRMINTVISLTLRLI